MTILFKAGITALAVVSAVSANSYFVSTNDIYQGNTFFDGFDFFTDDDPTHGYVDYVSRSVASSSRFGAPLISTTEFQASWGVDYLNKVPLGNRGRPSIRLQTKKTYHHGLFIIDLAHMPSNTCGSWPAFWTTNIAQWPNGGEIDIIEGVNEELNSYQVLHTGQYPGCTIAGNQLSNQMTGSIASYNCWQNANWSPFGAQWPGQACAATNNVANNYGSSFNSNGGGVYAMEWTNSTISIWNFARNVIPVDIKSGKPVPSTWGRPSFTTSTGSCDIESNFQPHQVIFNTAFCGDWAGQDQQWQKTSCHLSNPILYPDCRSYVQANPQAFKDSYWTVNSLKVYQSHSDVPESSSTSSTTSSTTATSSTIKSSSTDISSITTIKSSSRSSFPLSSSSHSGVSSSSSSSPSHSSIASTTSSLTTSSSTLSSYTVTSTNASSELKSTSTSTSLQASASSSLHPDVPKVPQATSSSSIESKLSSTSTTSTTTVSSSLSKSLSVVTFSPSSSSNSSTTKSQAVETTISSFTSIMPAAAGNFSSSASSASAPLQTLSSSTILPPSTTGRWINSSSTTISSSTSSKPILEFSTSTTSTITITTISAITSQPSSQLLSASAVPAPPPAFPQPGPSSSPTASSPSPPSALSSSLTPASTYDPTETSTLTITTTTITSIPTPVQTSTSTSSTTPTAPAIAISIPGNAALPDGRGGYNRVIPAMDSEGPSASLFPSPPSDVTATATATATAIGTGAGAGAGTGTAATVNTTTTKMGAAKTTVPFTGGAATTVFNALSRSHSTLMTMIGVITFAAWGF